MADDPNSAPSPQLFFETVGAHLRTAALKAALELKLFTAIGGEEATAETIAGRCGASPRGTAILCDYLAAIGFLTKEDQRYQSTADTATFLDESSPAYLGGTTEFTLSGDVFGVWNDVASAVRKGGTVTPDSGTLAPEHPMWVQFARAMAPMMRLPADLMAEELGGAPGQKQRILDIAAGHGVFGIAFAQRNGAAEVVAVDWPNVLAVAEENAKAAGVEKQHSLLPGSAFEVDFGGGYDLILITNFLHHFDASTCETLLKKIHASLADGGRAATLEFIPNEDRVSPPEPVAFSLRMLVSTPGGQAYTFSEYERMFKNAGFSQSKSIALPGSIQELVVSTK